MLDYCAPPLTMSQRDLVHSLTSRLQCELANEENTLISIQFLDERSQTDAKNNKS